MLVIILSDIQFIFITALALVTLVFSIWLVIKTIFKQEEDKKRFAKWCVDNGYQHVGTDIYFRNDAYYTFSELQDIYTKSK